MTNTYINKYHSLLFFFTCFVLNFLKEDLQLNHDLSAIICFFLIATIGISHGALDNQKGLNLFKKLEIKNIAFFYLSYVILAILVISCWLIFSTFTLIIFLLVASFHFGKEDNVFELRKIKLVNLLHLSKGSLIILAPLYFKTKETIEIFTILNVSMGNIDERLIIGFMILGIFSSFIVNRDFLYSFLDCFSIILLNYTFSPLVAFTIYFCFLHSIRHSITLVFELDNKNFLNGAKIFFKKALPLTVITAIIFVSCFYAINNYYSLNSSILKVVFIGLASLTFPHILLEYLIEKYEKRT